MKKIVFTQRVEVLENYGERRDCADQHISDFILACGFLPIPMPNRPHIVDTFIEEVKPDGIFFSGGNDLASYGGNAPERDEVENWLIEYAENNDIPLFGICRGMQMIAACYGARIEEIEKHIRVNHPIRGQVARDAVNSFHRLGIRNVPSPLVELARSDDGVIEAICHKDFRIMAIMWHPERMDGFSQDDIRLVSNFYNGGEIA